jgi:uncharacterized damage-inducible protein DinB
MSKYPNAGTVKFYRERHSVETALTLEVLRASPAYKLAYKPNEQSSSAGTIFWTVVRGLITRNEVAASGDADPTAGPPQSYRMMLAQFEGLSTALADKLYHLSQSKWERTARLRVGRQVVLEKTVGAVLWLFHFDLIHHRGQLTTYLRPGKQGAVDIGTICECNRRMRNSGARRVNNVLTKAGAKL